MEETLLKRLMEDWEKIRRNEKISQIEKYFLYKSGGYEGIVCFECGCELRTLDFPRPTIVCSNCSDRNRDGIWI